MTPLQKRQILALIDKLIETRETIAMLHSLSEANGPINMFLAEQEDRADVLGL